MVRIALHCKRWMVLAALAAGILLASHEWTASAQNKEADSADAEGAKRRLPANYGKLKVTGKQRTAIFRIQDKFNEKIDKLEAEIERLKQERDAKCAEALTDEQRAELAKLQDSADENRILGRVTLGGRPAAGVVVTLEGNATEQATTNDDGRFTFRDLAPGKYTLKAKGTVKNEERSSKPTPVEVASPPAKPAKVTIELE